MPPDTNDILYASLGTMTHKRGADGFLYVTGKMSDDTLDLDKQIVDPEWLDSEAPDWFKIGNTRVMHQPVVGGKATKLVKNGTGWDATIKVTNPQAATDVEEGALTGLSIGIKGARIIEDADAPNGRIVGGKIVELSLVDRPANPSCHLTLTKMAGGALELSDGVEIIKADAPDCETCDGTGKIKDGNVKCPDCNGTGDKSVEPDLVKKDFSDAERKAMAEKGEAMPGGGFPINSVGSLKDAVQSIGRAKDPTAAKAHIKSRAAALGKDDLIPASWKSVEADLTKAKPDEMTHDPADLAMIRTGLVNVLKAELDELASGSDDEVCDLYELLNSLSTFLCWWEGEAHEDETTPPFPEDSGDDTMAYIGLGVSADLIKSATADDASDEVKDELRTEIVKALGLEGKIATKAEFEAQQETIKGLEAALKDVREMAAPGQPALRATLDQQTKSAEADELESKAVSYRMTSMHSTDPETARQYADAADELVKRAKDLRPQTL
jgi:hypothetical protein